MLGGDLNWTCSDVQDIVRESVFGFRRLDAESARYTVIPQSEPNSGSQQSSTGSSSYLEKISARFLAVDHEVPPGVRLEAVLGSPFLSYRQTARRIILAPSDLAEFNALLQAGVMR